MSDPDSPKAADRPLESEAELESVDARKMADLLKHAMGQEAAPERPLLVGVQRKLRQRSRGKFYGDGWSTTDARVSYALVAAIMLLILGVAYFALGPVGIAPK
jgi:hypothetical protein